MADMMTKKS